MLTADVWQVRLLSTFLPVNNVEVLSAILSKLYKTLSMSSTISHRKSFNYGWRNFKGHFHFLQYSQSSSAYIYFCPFLAVLFSGSSLPDLVRNLTMCISTLYSWLNLRISLKSHHCEGVTTMFIIYHIPTQISDRYHAKQEELDVMLLKHLVFKHAALVYIW